MNPNDIAAHITHIQQACHSSDVAAVVQNLQSFNYEAGGAFSERLQALELRFQLVGVFREEHVKLGELQGEIPSQLTASQVGDHEVPGVHAHAASNYRDKIELHLRSFDEQLQQTSEEPPRQKFEPHTIIKNLQQDPEIAQMIMQEITAEYFYDADWLRDRSAMTRDAVVENLWSVATDLQEWAAEWGNSVPDTKNIKSLYNQIMNMFRLAGNEVNMAVNGLLSLHGENT